MPNIIYIPDSTWTDLDQKPIFQKFMKEYLDLLQNNLINNFGVYIGVPGGRDFDILGQVVS